MSSAHRSGSGNSAQLTPLPSTSSRQKPVPSSRCLPHSKNSSSPIAEKFSLQKLKLADDNPVSSCLRPPNRARRQSSSHEIECAHPDNLESLREFDASLTQVRRSPRHAAESSISNSCERDSRVDAALRRSPSV